MGGYYVEGKATAERCQSNQPHGLVRGVIKTNDNIRVAGEFRTTDSFMEFTISDDDADYPTYPTNKSVGLIRFTRSTDDAVMVAYPTNKSVGLIRFTRSADDAVMVAYPTNKSVGLIRFTRSAALGYALCTMHYGLCTMD